ncbi:MAG: alanine racemase [Ilumatobacteraceae bacterium]
MSRFPTRRKLPWQLLLRLNENIRNAMTTQRWAWADIDLSALQRNVRTLCTHVNPQQLWAVVKANAYGHGSIQVATAALDAGATGLCVALADEGIEFRHAGIDAPILVMSEQPNSQHRTMIENDLIATLYNKATIGLYAQAANTLGRIAKVHLKIDTGMHRVGAPDSEAVSRAQQIVAEPNLQLDGLYTHFATADIVNHPGTEIQRKRFAQLVDHLRRIGINPAQVHVANSAAAIRQLDTGSTMVRVGIAMYGVATNAETDSFGASTNIRLDPVLSLKARVSHVQHVAAGEGISYGLIRPLATRTHIATLPLGYADGVPRQLWRAGEVLIGGRRRRIAGVVTMDQMMIDCGLDDVFIGDEAVLIGLQGTEHISANEWARHVDSIGYEVLCGISARVPRNYLRSPH